MEDLSPEAHNRYARPSITVRQIQPAEGASLRAIRLRALADSPSAFGSTLAETAARPPSYWDARARGDTGAQESTLFIAEDQGGWIGLVGCFGEEPGEPRGAELVSMWVDPAYRGQGVGRRLVEQVLDWARRHGAESVSLWVTDSNSAAASLYAGCGFQETGGDAAPSIPAGPQRAQNGPASVAERVRGTLGTRVTKEGTRPIRVPSHPC